MLQKITQRKLKELLDYDPLTGLFTCKVKRSPRAMPGTIAGGKDSDGYISICICGAKQKAHRLAFLWMEGYFPENDVDHIDRNPSNNKWENLREVSRQCNLRNCEIGSNNRSGVTGVSYAKRDKTWKACVKISYKNIYLGSFVKKYDAVKARWEAEIKYNFPNCNTTSSAYRYLQANSLKRIPEPLHGI